MPITRLSIPFLSLILCIGCGIDTFQCDDCEDPFIADDCSDQHFQFHQGVIFEPASGTTDIFEIEEISPFNESLVLGAKPYLIGNSKVLISTEFGNYVFDSNNLEIAKIDGPDSPIVGLSGADYLYYSNRRIDDIIINDSTVIDDLIARSTLKRVHIGTNETHTVKSSESYFVHPDTLLIPKLFFPVEVAGYEGFIALAEDEYHYVSVSSSNRVFTFFLYKERSWKQFNEEGEIINILTAPIKIESEQDPRHPTFSINPPFAAYQEDERVVVSNLETGSVTYFEQAQSPQLSENGEFISLVSNNLIDVYSISTSEKTSISEENDYGSNNPSVFSKSSNTLLFAEKNDLSPTLDNAVLKRASFDSNDPLIEGTVFELSDHIKIDSLDFLISRASKPVFLNDQEIFFLVFQHQLNSCDRFF